MEGITENVVTMYCCMYPGCNKNYSTKFNLRRHVNIVHLTNKKHACQKCLRCFASSQNLKEHMHIHSGIKPFVCPICRTKFRQTSQLTVHRRSHQDEFLED
ncbi:unnamed protein product [Blepharisma stoltei]|uniref:C2H2-type domain-containing protein n=1 Tax=Blepharisma stoltei TaxID=1481888 RepID=A0AAU9J9C3_9CILI|nr:unnamed protein product [Blepharisma stoltei]